MAQDSRRIILVCAGAAVVGAIAVSVLFVPKKERSEEAARSSLHEPDSPAPPTRTRVSPRAEDPAHEPPGGAKAVPAVRDPVLASFVNPNLKAGERIPNDISTRIPRIKHAEDMTAVVSVLKNPEEDEIVRNEAANLLRRSNFAELTDCLIEILNREDETGRFRGFCVQHIWGGASDAPAGEKEKITESLHAAAQDRHIAVRREALLALVRMKDARGKELAVSWLTSPEGEPVRDLAIRCVRELDLREQAPAVRRCLEDPREPVKIAAMVALSEWRDTHSVPAIREAAQSGSPRVKRAAEEALKRIAEGK